MSAPARYAPPPRIQAIILTPLRPLLEAWFRPRVQGLDDVPKDRPVIFVTKHPKGFLYLETILLGFIVYWVKRDRPLIRPMEQRNTSLHRTPILGFLRRNVNTVPATEEAGLATLAAGESLLIFPGGGRELYGPPDTLDWYGRRGFARIAAKARVPVVPVAIAGADRQHPLRIPLGGKRSLWFPPFPLPVRLDYAFGAPMEPPPPEDADAVADFAERVAEETQALIDRTVAARGRQP
jgi:1-acyl-sn-glycerol-3-phosphate acyltransferase